MILSHFWGLLFHPDQEWTSIREHPPGIIRLYLGQVIWLAAVPALCTYIGTTQTGWSLPGSDQVVKLTETSAAAMAFFAWLAILAGVAIMGAFIQWMAETFGSKPTLTQSVAFSCYTAAPLFLAGLCGLYPSIWLTIVAGTIAASCSAWLLYTGLPTFMQIPKEQGFVYASSVLCIGLVVLVSIMITTVIFWGMGVGPEYIQVH
ncbi:Yip1 family protein [Endozoicomonas arenosclerae]|uniref:Yip1 family protein n=1 Tax=Endozoicomonas arenosclerae TaxID=1633495 RepID=UPI000AAD80B2|nr:Yip1 family protein [Endozoicomonas arenosclerae]